MRAVASLGLLWVLALGLLVPADEGRESPIAVARAEGSPEERLQEAERLFAEGSYAQAHRIFAQLAALVLDDATARWIDFRLADSQWRAQAATRGADTTLVEQARQWLEELARANSGEEEHDRVWAETQESLGDFWWTRLQARNWGPAWEAYRQALDWWAGSSDIDLARGRYLGIVWRMAEPPEVEPYYSYGYYGNVIPLELLDNALSIASTDEDRAHAQYLIARTLQYGGGDWQRRRRVPEAFEAALATGRSTAWYDDALFHYAEWLAYQGRAVRTEDGQWRQEPDFVRAVGLYRRLLGEFAKGETRYYDDAARRVAEITGPQLSVSVSNIFLADSEIEYQLGWRNLARIELSLYPVDLTRDVSFASSDDGSGSWLQQIDLQARRPTTQWTHDTGDNGEHRPQQAVLRLERDLPLGAYVLRARAGERDVRELVLVTDATLVVKTTGRRALVYACDVLSGSPLVGAAVVLWERLHDDGGWLWRAHRGTTGDDGVVLIDLEDGGDDGYSRDLFVAAAVGDRQALSTANAYRQRSPGESWRIYAFTDRPAYRPGEEARWKLVARRYDGAVYTTPAGERLRYQITDARGATVDEGETTLNAFGSAWGSLMLTEAMPLGEYRVRFSTGEQRSIGQATLFRLEEYKLPEFKVSVRTPEQDGRRRTYRLGDIVEVLVEAEYYFGGPVTNATVELLVHQTPYRHWWFPPSKYPWFYEDLHSQPWGSWGGGQIVKRETLATDADGRVRMRFETPAAGGQDFEYRIEARVTDASRREIVGADTVRVTGQGYYVHPRARHYLYRPQDQVVIDIHAEDANGQPVAVRGNVELTRDRWYEVWLDPEGREVTGDALRRLRDRVAVFPPGPDWQLKFRGYEHDRVLERGVTTDAEGNAEFSFVPERDGYYRVAWTSEDPGGAPIAAEATVWVASDASTELGYRPGGIEIVADRDTFHAGERVPVMLAAPGADRWVLFTVEADELYEYRLVHLSGTVKLLWLDVDERWVPNVFLGAAMVADRELFMDTEQIVVPPERHFLDVDLAFDRAEYRPRDEGTLTVRATDHEGRPVSAEVALGVVDESVFYIQQDYAIDPRQFFFGAKRANRVGTQGTLYYRGYRRLVADAEGRLVDAELKEDERAWRQDVPGRRLQAEGVTTAGAAFAEGDVARAKSARPSAMDAADELLAAPPAPPGEPAEGAAVVVRSDFRSTALWLPDVVTGADGSARVPVRFPDSTTGWQATARAAGEGARFGVQFASARTRQPLIVRLQAPRFFVVGDRLTVSAVINNNTAADLSVAPELEVEGLELLGSLVDGHVVAEREPLVVRGGGEARADWQVAVRQPGNVRLTASARGGAHADAMERTLSAYPHGIEKFLARSGKLDGDEITLELELPRERATGSTELVVQVAPSLATALLDALPYLIDYPYGCTEQTMSRFLPAAIVVRALRDLGLRPEDVAGRVFGGIVAEHAGATHPDGAKSLAELDRMVREGLGRLYDLQHGDGGWGWWRGGDSDPFMTSYVVWGLSLARETGIDVRSNALERSVSFLDQALVEQETSYDLQAFMLHALAAHRAASGNRAMSKPQVAAFDNLWQHRDRLNAYTRALLALSAHRFGDAERAAVLVRNLENGVVVDDAPDVSRVQRGAQRSSAAVQATAHWGQDGIYWRWSDGAVESTAFALRALLAIDPQHRLVGPVANWLVKNRRGAQWSSTRDTAIAVLALTDYLRASGELETDTEYDLLVNGSTVARERLTPGDVLGAPSRWTVDRGLLRDGVNEIRLVRRAGRGPLYLAAEARFFSLEEPIAAAGHEIFVRRQYHRQVGRPTLLKGYVYDTLPLDDRGTLKSGDRVEVVLTVEAKNDYEYLVFEDLKPAGLEAVQLRSGEPIYIRELKSGAVERRFGNADAPRSEGSDYTGRSRWVHQELRDRKVALFVDKLPQGVWELRYTLRAEVPGEFHGLPLLGHAMYVPEIRANGQEVRLTVVD